MSGVFTPGPWDCTGCTFPDDGMGGVYYRIQAKGIDASAANARLIAAAPELYGTLDHIRELLVAYGPRYIEKATKLADAALAKARGDQ